MKRTPWTQRILPLAVLLAGLPSTIFAYPVGIPDAARMAEDADVVCTGRVLEILPGSSEEAGGRRYSASFQVDRLIKGKADPFLKIEFTRIPGVPTAAFSKDEYSLVFLKSGTAGIFRLVDPFMGVLFVSEAPPPVVEFAAGTMQLLRNEFIGSLADDRPNVVRTAVEQLAHFPGTGTLAALRRKLYLTSDDALRGRIYGTLIRLGQYGMLSEARSFSERQTEDSEISRSQAAVTEAIAEIRDPRMIGELDLCLRSDNTLLRRGAARALRFMVDPAAGESLVMALEDPDTDVRYESLLGLAALTGDTETATPSRDEFQSREDVYLGQSKQRWLRYRDLKAPQGKAVPPKSFQLHDGPDSGLK